jgi:hypothetical protein
VSARTRPLRADEYARWREVSAERYAGSGLYRSLGYEERAVFMGKGLA